MGLFGKKKEIQENQATPPQTDSASKFKTKIKALKEIGRYSIEQKNKLQDEEADTIRGIETIKDSFDVVKDKYSDISDSVVSFQDQFNNIEEITKAFEDIVKNLVATADDSHNGMENVDKSSSAVADTITEVEEVFAAFQQSFDDIRGKVEQIGGFAKQTNLLALNASIEAARAGEAGR